MPEQPTHAATRQTSGPNPANRTVFVRLDGMAIGVDGSDGVRRCCDWRYSDWRYSDWRYGLEVLEQQDTGLTRR